MRLVTAEQMRKLDGITIQQVGIPGVVLMEAAGRAVASVIREHLDLEGARVAILCGRGNNGGDGYVAARHLLARGAHVQVTVLAARERIQGDAAVNLAVLERLGHEPCFVTSEAELRKALEGLSDAQVVVDALLGTGLSSEVRGLYAEAIEAMNAAAGLKVAVDIPSGLHADTGKVLGKAFRADVTVTFGLPKIGLVSYPGAEHVGDLYVADIGIPPSVAAEAGEPEAYLLEETRARLGVVPRPMGGHKGTFGHVLVLAGGPGKTGAALLAGRAAARAGAGLVTLALPRSVQPIVQAAVTHLMTEPYPHEDPVAARERLTGLMEGKTVLAAGPGLPPTEETRSLLLGLLSERALEDKPVILDAEALNLLAGHMDTVARSPARVVLTPHPGEAARLLGTSTAQVQADRVTAARRLAELSRALVVLKGARTVVATSEGSIWINPTGNPGLGTGGAGDVLTGLVAGLAAPRGARLLDAVLAGVYAHGLAADRAARHLGETALVATDLLETLPNILSAWERGESVWDTEAQD